MKARKRIRNVDNYLNQVEDNQKFQLVVDTKTVTPALSKAAGLEILNINKTILPKEIGPITRLNANGKYTIRKDLPKELRYITTREWCWKQWTTGGGTETCCDFKDIYRECYPRQLTPPPGLEISKVLVKGVEYFTTLTLIKTEHQREANLHAINLFLEIFGSFKIVVNGEFTQTKFEKMNWRFLPPGEYPWEKIINHVKQNNKRTDSYTKVILDRQNFLLSKKPARIYTGQGGFREYVAYVFNGFAILDSITLGNALYIFGQDWELVSRMTKADIIEDNLALARIIHKNGWKVVTAELIDKLQRQKSRSEANLEL